jgi:membrane protease YdiL (CAAX protease family)
VNGWLALGVFYTIALAVVCGVMMYAGRIQARRPETRSVFPDMFAWLDERNTYPNTSSIARFCRERPFATVILIFAAAPSLAAVVTAIFGADEAGLVAMLRRLAPWNDRSALAAMTTYAVIIAIFVVVAMIYLNVATRYPVEPTPPLLRERSVGRRWGRIVGGMFIDEGGTLEELGWRGFALPVFVGAVGSLWWPTLVLGVAWWAWHIPREVPALLHQPNWRRFVTSQAQFVLLCVALSGLMTVAWHHTGSVWPAVMIHGGTNVWSKAIGASMWERTGRDIRTYIVVGLAIVVVAAEILV